MNVSRGFKGVWIPAELWMDRKLSMTEKVMLVEIDTLSNDERGCFATNAHFADFFDLSKSRVSEIISALASKGYVRVVVKRKGEQIIGRSIFTDSYSGFWKNPIRESDDPSSEKALSSNTNSSNTKSNNTRAPLGEKKPKSGAKVTLAQYATANPEASWAPEGGKAAKHLLEIGVPPEWIAYAFRWFRDRYWDSTDPKYSNWPAAFANAVVDNWGKLWYFDQKTNAWALTSQGMAYKIKVDGGAQ